MNKNDELKTVLILGGYGNFGKRITENLASIENIKLLVAGRNLAKGNALVEQLKEQSVASLQAVALDINDIHFEQQLLALAPDMVLHTCGPFQGQSYHVAQACIKVGAHYIDLADDRRFVCDINSLDRSAKKHNVTVVSGASSVPGLSSAVIDHYHTEFKVINSLDIAIAPGNKAERGVATVNAILSYTGHAFEVYRQGKWQAAYGWMNSRKVDFGDIVGKRWLANVDVPDLELFPNRYNVLDEVKFQAGLELSFLHLSMQTMAWLSKLKLIKNWSVLTRPIVSTSNLFLPFGTDKGAMRVVLSGIDHQNKVIKRSWHLYAPDGYGPYIPTFSMLILARKLISEELNQPGASACVGLLSLQDFESYFDGLGIYQKESFEFG